MSEKIYKYLEIKDLKDMLNKSGERYGKNIAYKIKIEEGFYLGHPYNITINEESILGKNINIHKGATIGKENRGKKLGAPKIGNNVYIGVNSTVVGKIEIGNDVLIAPNSYLNFNVPSHSIVIGSPGVIIPNEKATEGYVNFCV